MLRGVEIGHLEQLLQAPAMRSWAVATDGAWELLRSGRSDTMVLVRRSTMGQINSILVMKLEQKPTTSVVHGFVFDRKGSAWVCSEEEGRVYPCRG